MARTQILPQPIVDTGLEATTEAANVDGNSVPGTGNIIVHVINADASPITVTILTGGTFRGKAVADTAVVVTNAEERFIGLFRADLYNDPVLGEVLIDYSAVANVTVAAYSV